MTGTRSYVATVYIKLVGEHRIQINLWKYLQ